LKHLDRFYNNTDTPWVTLTWTKLYNNNHTPPQARSLVGSFWWKKIMKLFNTFKALAKCNPTRGNTDLLWSGTWTDQPLKDKYPQLYSYSRKPK
jgi:hypothetical protein